MTILKCILIFVFLFNCDSKDGTPKAIITTPQGKIEIVFFRDVAPNHSQNFIKLAEEGFYNGTTFHRVERGYLIQGGDFKSKNNTIFDDGTGELNYTIESEAKLHHFKGAVAMAKKPLSMNPDNRSSACQFYIALDSLSNLDPENYTIFGKVTKGFDTLEKIQELEIQYDMNPNTNWKKVTEMTIEIVYEKHKYKI